VVIASYLRLVQLPVTYAPYHWSDRGETARTRAGLALVLMVITLATNVQPG
jgi:hypothetical protein